MIHSDVPADQADDLEGRLDRVLLEAYQRILQKKLISSTVALLDVVGHIPSVVGFEIQIKFVIKASCYTSFKNHCFVSEEID